MIGQTFGYLTVIERLNRDKKLGMLFRCRCECGNERTVPHSNLLTGNTRSCGCLKLRANGLPFRGASRLRAFQTWKHMRERCEDPANKSYPRYGGRGIKVCDGWLRFENFFADMGERPPGLTLERVDNERDYEPSNCIWADMRRQQNNRSNNRLITYRGEARTIAQWARELNMPSTTLTNRLRLLGWTVERAFTEPRMRSYPRQ